MKNILPLLAILLLTSCNNTDGIVVQDMAINETDSSHQEVPPPFPPPDPSLLPGSWTDGSTENSTFFISNGDIQYTDQLQSFPYTLSNDSIEIMFEDYTYKAQISIINDTLFMRSEDGESTFWRFKQ